MSQRYLGGVITANPTTPTLTTSSGVWTLEQQFQYSSVWSPEIIGNSVRLRSSASAFLGRTPASATNRQTWTWSGWVKRGSLSGSVGIFGAFLTNNNTETGFRFDSNTLNFYSYVSSYLINATTSAVFRDPSAWYHIVLAVDTTQATNSNGVRLWVNGVQQTLSFSAYTQNHSTYVNNNNQHYIGRDFSGAYLDAYIAEINFIDGRALTPSSFGAFDTNGVWQPLLYTGAYGTNGFYLTFADNSAATATTLGKDYSGNGNNWTPNNISVTSGVTYDWMLDSPTNFPNASTGIGNYATFNPLLYMGTGSTKSNGNLKFAGGGSGGPPYNYSIYGTFTQNTGKWYWETTITAAGGQPFVGMFNTAINFSGTSLQSSAGPVLYGYDGNYYNETTGVAFGSTYTTNDVIGVAVDYDNNLIWFSKNGTWQNSGVPASGTNGKTFGSGKTWGTGYVESGSSASPSTFDINFGQRPFAYTPPTGFKALNTQNLPVPNITNGAQYFAASTYTGTGATQSINNGTNNTIGTTFQPDFVWLKSRSSVLDHQLFDAIRGAGVRLYSNLTNAEDTFSGSLSSFNSNGFSLGSGAGTNGNAVTYIGWQWRAGVSAVTNTAGTITSTVDAGTTQGFSIVTYTTTGSVSTAGHGLGVAPRMIITKQRNGTTAWYTYHASIGATNSLLLNSTAAQAASSAIWNNTAPTSSVFTLGSGFGAGETYVAYCFAQVAGFSAFGSYTGNGSTDGPFVFCGFRPRWVMVKRTDTTSDWTIWDTSRDTYNAVNLRLFPNLSSAEAGGVFLDVLSNGFKIRDTGAAVNGSGGTFIYACFAENPFNIARAR